MFKKYQSDPEPKKKPEPEPFVPKYYVKVRFAVGDTVYTSRSIDYDSIGEAEERQREIGNNIYTQSMFIEMRDDWVRASAINSIEVITTRPPIPIRDLGWG